MAACLGNKTHSNTTSSNTVDLIIRSRDDREEPRIALGGQVGAGCQLSRRIGLEAGIGYFQLGWQGRIDAGNFIFRGPVDALQADPAIPERITVSEFFHYLDLRLGATLTLGQGRWRLVLALGVAPALLIAARTRTYSEYSDGLHTHESRDPAETFNAFNLFPYFSTGVAFHSGGRWEWRLQPSVRYGAMRIIDAPITAHVFSGTVDLGVRFAL